MKKKFLISMCMAVSVMAIMLTACSSGSSSTQTTTAAAESEANETEAEASETEAAETEAPAEAVEAAQVLTGTGDGYGGPITAEVYLDEDGRIIDLVLTGNETPTVGALAFDPLIDAIVAAGTIDGVDAYSGATWTSNGVFAAVKDALGIVEEEEVTELQAMTATGLSHGLGIYSSGRIGPGEDELEEGEIGVYCINIVAAYALFDDDGTILDLEIDQIENATPNYDGEYVPDFTGFPGQSYEADTDHDGTVDTVLEQTEETYPAEISSWTNSKRYRSNYFLDSGTWAEEIDIFESKFIGMNIDEIEPWFEKYCSDLNGTVLFGNSDNEEDIVKYEQFTEEDLAEIDSVSGATISLNDEHGNIIGAILKAYDNRRSIEADKISKVGLGISCIGRLGPGSDDQGTGVYSFDIQFAGISYDEEDCVAAMYVDTLEVATPNYDGASMPDFTGFPGQAYNADEDHDGKVDAVWEQTEESFLEQIAAWRTKRERGQEYKLDSASWADEMNIYEAYFVGMTSDEILAWYEKYCSDVTGRVLSDASGNESDIAKYDALTDEEKSSLDALSGATMSLSDSHGDIIGAIADTGSKARETDITIE